MTEKNTVFLLACELGSHTVSWLARTAVVSIAERCTDALWLSYQRCWVYTRSSVAVVSQNSGWVL